MTGALIQLVAKGIQDIFITQDPQITYFKIVYRRHTNFSMESIMQKFNHMPNFGKKSTCTIAQNGDLMGQTWLVVTLPEIKQSLLTIDNNPDPHLKFAWVRKLGYALIKTVEIEIGGQLIDRQYGDWLNIVFELFCPKELEKSNDYMIGNIDKLIEFSETKKSYTLYVPLQFWFCKNPNLALPILCLHHTDVKINIEFADINNCFIQTPTNYFRVSDNVCTFKFGEYIEQTVNGKMAAGQFCSFIPSPDTNTGGHILYSKITRNDFVSPFEIEMSIPMTKYFNKYSDYIIKSRDSTNICFPNFNNKPKIYNKIDTTSINIQDCYLLVNYFYLDNDERNRFIQNKHEYLIDQLQIFNPQYISSSNYIANADTINPIKFMTWCTQQEYLLDDNNNDSFNYTDDYYYKKINGKYKQIGKSLVLNESILYNGFDRISDRTSMYFNHLQSYQHFTKTPSEGINCYSYSIKPKEFQPMGSCNMSFINNADIKLRLKTLINENNNALFCGYVQNYNILRIMDGLAGLVFIR
jgi:hypothetical protein